MVPAWRLLDKNLKRKNVKHYRAIIWTPEPNRPGQRVRITAESLTEAKMKLEAEYGEGNVFDLHSEEDAAQPR